MSFLWILQWWEGYAIPKWFSTLIVLTGWMIWCLMRSTPPTDRIPYSSHPTGLSPKWISWHCLRMELWLRVLPHPLCSQGASLPWNPSCLISSEHSWKAFLHPLRAYGFSPVWILWCWMSFTFVKAFTFIAFTVSTLCELADVMWCWNADRCLPQTGILSKMNVRMGAPRKFARIHNKDVLSNMNTVILNKFWSLF